MKTDKLCLISIVLLSCLVFFYKIFVIQTTIPYILEYDCFGHIQLGNNIFNHFDFTVPWEIDHPVIYPPLIPILIHLLTLITKNPIQSVQYISAFGSSFILIPLFLMVKRMLNIPSAVLAVIFTLDFFTPRGSIRLLTDSFLALMVMVICWYVWELLARDVQRRRYFFLAGILIGLCYLNKFSGMFFVLSATASICFYCRDRYAFKDILKRFLFVWMGFLIIFGSYQLALHSDLKGQKVYDIGIHTFEDGNYRLNNKRSTLMYALNRQGDEFNHYVLCQNTNVLDFAKQYPSFLWKKFLNGNHYDLAIMAKRIIPAMSGHRYYIYAFHCLILLLLTLFGIYFRWEKKIVHIGLFLIFVIFIPIYCINEARYLIPFMPLYFVLLLFVLNGIGLFIKSTLKNEWLWKFLVAVVFLKVFLIYATPISRTVFMFDKRDETVIAPYYQAALWLKDHNQKKSRIKVMSAAHVMAYLTDADFITLPSERDWSRLIHFASLRNVDYIVLDNISIMKLYPQMISLMQDIPRDLSTQVFIKDEKESVIVIRMK